MDYVLIKNGKIVVDGELRSKDVLIGNDKLIDVDDAIERPEPETPVIDASGKFLLPGTIDTNIFFSELIMQDEEALKRFNQAHISCGTTTVIEPVFPQSSFLYKEELLRKKEVVHGINADYGYHLSLNDWKELSGNDIDYCYAHEGVASFYLKWPVKPDEHKRLEKLLKFAAKDSTPILVEMHKPGEESFWYESASAVYAETIASHINQLDAFLQIATELGCVVCIQNVCFKEELDVIEEYATSGHVYAELMFPFHISNSDRIAVDGRSVYSGLPVVEELSLLSEETIWRCLKQQNYFVARPMSKLFAQGVVKDSQVDNRPDEYFLIRNLLSVLFTWGVTSGRITFAELIDLMACRTAKFMGLFPQKGIIRVGSDADVVIWEPGFKRNLYCHLPGMQEKVKNFFPLQGRVEFVFVKGQMVYNGESFSDDLVKGRYLYRSPYL
ncbi:amidohydrolase family protein [Carboxylicivirga sp. A043]|uniref:amidohydrolase family protein n=1 Tax=Carboxylicivirga litoralis TaxID=2816963 RepID=UPI0021CB8C16|nr:amidohydrolase family protein [Carboxylicivirga sp. A043]MCU4155727.1 amidohydrolase family protein [Carboxylicivirga sp. A043]